MNSYRTRHGNYCIDKNQALFRCQTCCLKVLGSQADSFILQGQRNADSRKKFAVAEQPQQLSRRA